jgi:hypothetical protein
MPLVRIVSHAGEASKALAEELRSRDFDVEALKPGQKSHLLPDVEIHLNDCPVHEALQRVDTVAEIASQNAEAIAESMGSTAGAESSDWPIWQVEQPSVITSEAVIHTSEAPESSTADEPSTIMPAVDPVVVPIVSGRLVRVRVPAKDRWFWRAAAGAAACALFGLLMIATLHRLAPFADKLAGAHAETKEAEPFQKIDDLAGDSLEMQSLQNASLRSEEPARSEASSRRHRSRHHSSANRRDGNFVAANSVVRYNDSPAPQSKTPAKSHTNGIKHYSDLKQ